MNVPSKKKMDIISILFFNFHFQNLKNGQNSLCVHCIFNLDIKFSDKSVKSMNECSLNLFFRPKTSYTRENWKDFNY